jgi:hypothetical protein
MVARLDLRTGTVLQAKHLTFKKPGTGIPADRLEDVIGRKLARAVKADALITENDLVPAGGIALQACGKSLKKQQARKTTAWRTVRHHS